MKTINGFKARYIISHLNVSSNTALFDFESTGDLKNDLINGYHSEIKQMLDNPHAYYKKDLQDIQLLKNYFTKYAPMPVTKLRDESNIVKLEFNNVMYAGEKTIFHISWSELGITLMPDPSGKSNTFSISLLDARELAKQILNY